LIQLRAVMAALVAVYEPVCGRRLTVAGVEISVRS
jgi:hypothetical protein